MTTRIDELPSTVLPSGEHEVAAMKDGLTVKLTVNQIITLAKALILDNAPDSLDTLNELAAALNDDPDFATNIMNQLAAKLPLTGGVVSGLTEFQNNIRVSNFTAGSINTDANGNLVKISQAKKLIGFDYLFDSADYERTSATAGSMGPVFEYTALSSNSSFVVEWLGATVNQQEGGTTDDCRGTSRLYHDPGTGYLQSSNGLTSSTIGWANGSVDSNEDWYLQCVLKNFYEQGDLDNGVLKLRHYGEADHADTRYEITDQLFTVWEFENVV